MKRIVLFGFALLVAGNVLAQTPMDKEQQKKVKDIHKRVAKEHDIILKNLALTVDEKKARVAATQNDRDAQLAALLNSEQITAVKAKDPIAWSKVYSRIEKQEKSRLKDERDQKLKEVDRQIKELDSQQSDVKRQMDELKRKQKELDAQHRALKAQHKEIVAQYK